MFSRLHHCLDVEIRGGSIAWMGDDVNVWVFDGSYQGRGVLGTIAICVTEGMESGNDMIMPGGREDMDGILAGLEHGEITREELEKCAGRILAIAKRLS